MLDIGKTVTGPGYQFHVPQGWELAEPAEVTATVDEFGEGIEADATRFEVVMVQGPERVNRIQVVVTDVLEEAIDADECIRMAEDLAAAAENAYAVPVSPVRRWAVGGVPAGVFEYIIQKEAGPQGHRWAFFLADGHGYMVIATMDSDVTGCLSALDSLGDTWRWT
jgi:hypothetical protein